MTTLITLETTLELHTCPACGVAWAAPDQFFVGRRSDHNPFFCPNGHSLSYSQPNDLEKAQAEIAKLKKLFKEEQAYAAEAISERNTAQKSLRATKGELTKTKQRIANGVCPCCNRSFANLREHMHMEHPEYQEEPKA